MAAETAQSPPAEAADQKSVGVVRSIVARLDRRTVNGFIILGSFVSVAFILLFLSPPEEAKNFLLPLLGLLGGMAKDVIGYDYNSSAGSEKKDDAMIATAKKREAT